MASPSEKVFPTYDETVGSKLLRKSKDMPFVPVGLAGFFSLAAYGIYRLKHRGETKMSIHLIHTRMAAQGFVVGSIVCGKLAGWLLLRPTWRQNHKHTAFPISLKIRPNWKISPRMFF
uniref:HIG1 hypoxia inducible domain family member 1A n=1 Tax=Pseudonaja textilis TaxID=8673 RepID=A0A670ZWD9_PSETE